jgi:hypothetical protein
MASKCLSRQQKHGDALADELWAARLAPDLLVRWSRLGRLPMSCGGYDMTNFFVYLIGTLFVVAGLAYAASRMGLATPWIVAGALVILGVGLMGGIVRTRQKDPAQ